MAGAFGTVSKLARAIGYVVLRGVRPSDLWDGLESIVQFYSMAVSCRRGKTNLD